MWKDIKNYEGLYVINEFGDIKNYLGKKINPYVNEKGYFKVGLTKEKRLRQHFVHKLVAETFKPDKTIFKSMPDENITNIDLNKLKVNHKDENKQNNNFNNLEWCTTKYNNNYGSKTNALYQKDLNGKILHKWDSITQASKSTKISIASISECLNYNRKTAGGFVWRWIIEKEDKPLFEINWDEIEKGDYK